MSTNNQAVAARFFDEICNARKLEVAYEIFAAGHVHHDPSNPWLAQGAEGVKQLVSTYQAAFSDAHWAVEEMIATGDTVVVRWTGTGTHDGNLPGVAPTGKSVNVAGIWIMRFADGKIVESWDVWDTWGMMQQLGVIGQTGSAASAA